MKGWGKIKAGAEYGGVKPRTFRDWLRLGLKHSRLPSGTILVAFDDIDEFLKRFEVQEDRVSQIADETMRDLKGDDD